MIQDHKEKHYNGAGILENQQEKMVLLASHSAFDPFAFCSSGWYV
jgi:hypothetical protein